MVTLLGVAFFVQQNAEKMGDGNKKLKYFYGDDEKTYKIMDCWGLGDWKLC